MALVDPTHLTTRGLSRRSALTLLGASTLTAASGCCSPRGFPASSIAGEPRTDLGTPLRPAKALSGTALRHIDVHAHFFNASDMTVKGYLEGPVAHDMPPALAELIRLLAPFADGLASIAPTASAEFNELQQKFAQPGLAALGAQGKTLDDESASRRASASTQFYDLVKGSDFERKFNDLAAQQPISITSTGRDPGGRPLSPESLLQATDLGTQPTFSMLMDARVEQAKAPYAGGVLAFVGYMLSPRWANLRTYSQAFTDADGAFGIDMTLGALVDFDRWLECPPRSSLEDQIKLHQLLSKLSGGYMRPIVAYNPWTDVVEDGKALDRVIDAVKNRGFVGVKLYPPNGFRPLGNTDAPTPPKPGPSPADLDRVLAKFWDACVSLDVPVMAHTGETMGSDDAHDFLGGPQGWNALMARYADKAAPGVNLGHFGGDCDANKWTDQMADLMASKNGATVFGDIAYWSRLGLDDSGAANCGDARARLGRAVQKGDVGKHVMYGSDWLMLSRVHNWWLYPFDVADATKDIIDQNALFAGNAQRCFGSLLS